MCAAGGWLLAAAVWRFPRPLRRGARRVAWRPSPRFVSGGGPELRAARPRECELNPEGRGGRRAARGHLSRPELRGGRERGWGCVSERVRELSARADVELRVRAAEVRLDGLGGHEQRLRDLAVGQSIGCHAGGAVLARGERVPPA